MIEIGGTKMIVVNGTPISIGERLKDFRTLKGMTLEEVVEQLNVHFSKSTLSNFENDKNPIPLDKLDELLKVYGVSMVEFFCIEVEMEELNVFKKYRLSEDFVNSLLITNLLSKYSLDTLSLANVLSELFNGGLVQEQLFSGIGHYISPNVDYKYKREYLRLIIESLDYTADKKIDTFEYNTK